MLKYIFVSLSLPFKRSILFIQTTSKKSGSLAQEPIVMNSMEALHSSYRCKLTNDFVLMNG